MSRDTPFINQYRQIKDRYRDAILFFRMGDFYEMFFEDAHIGSKVLGVALTSKSTGKAGKVPLAGIPVKAADTYIARLVKSGHRVAICEQVEDPRKAKGLVKRDVLEVVTPGTVTDDSLLEGKRNNYIGGLSSRGNGRWGLSILDITTGEYSVTEVSTDELIDEVTRIRPAELVLPESWLSGVEGGSRPQDLDRVLSSIPNALTSTSPDWCFTGDDARDRLTKRFRTVTLDGFGCQELEDGLAAAGGLLSYLERVQPQALRMVRSIRPYTLEKYMIIDAGTLRNLEIFEPMRPDLRKATLLDVLDLTRTAMGGRLLRQWLLKPLRDVDDVDRRLDAVDELHRDPDRCSRVRDVLGEMGDLERLAGKIASRKATPRDVVSLRDTLEKVPRLAEELGETDSALLTRKKSSLGGFPETVEKIGRAIVDDPPAQVSMGGVIREGYDEELDEIRGVKKGGTRWIAAMQEEERKRTGIQSLKVGYNKVFGYYIEVTKPNLHLVPESYIRKQTLANGERFITEELKDMEMKILSAQERQESLETELFFALREELAGMIDEFKASSQAVAAVDLVSTFAEVARENAYTRPVVNGGAGITIVEGRHPVVERLILEESFIPNDLEFDETRDQIIILTGPNMAGKSTFLRQVGIIVLMAQAGSFVPASRAEIGVVDRIFTRVGASDSLASGQSTFLVEMNETANIIHNATGRSLVLLDEIGRGTSTYDGLSIAWAVTEHLHENEHARPRTIFATHYHELTQLAGFLPRVKNYNVLVREWGEQVVFLRKIEPGASDRSYGIHVARIAGIPEDVILRAQEILANLEKGEHAGENVPPLARGEHIPASSKGEQLSLFHGASDPHVEELMELLRSADVNTMRPLDALGLIDRLRKLLPDGGEGDKPGK